MIVVKQHQAVHCLFHRTCMTHGELAQLWPCYKCRENRKANDTIQCIWNGRQVILLEKYVLCKMQLMAELKHSAAYCSQRYIKILQSLNIYAVLIPTYILLHELFSLFFKECTNATLTGTQEPFFIRKHSLNFSKIINNKLFHIYSNLILFNFLREEQIRRSKETPVISNHSRWYYLRCFSHHRGIILNISELI